MGLPLAVRGGTLTSLKLTEHRRKAQSAARRVGGSPQAAVDSGMGLGLPWVLMLRS